VLKTILNFLREDYLDNYSEEKLRPLKIKFSPYMSKKLQEIAKTKGITEKEALKQLIENDIETVEKTDSRD
jgi:predicted DNA-binding protein